jgi:acylglycerol lipase
VTSLRTKDDLELELHEWPAEKPHAILGIVHGYGEHGARYAHVGSALSARGISCYAIDLRGHGSSKGIRGYVERFTDYHQDAEALLEHAVDASKKAGGVPIFLFAHSMGALVAIHWLLHGGGKALTGVVFSSPFLGVAVPVSGFKLAMARMMSKMWPTLALDAGLRGRDVCRDPEIASLYDSDPLMNKKARSRWYTEAMDAIEYVIDRGGELTHPTLLLYGADDKVVTVAATDRFAKNVKGPERTVDRLAGCYHELVNELPEVRTKIIDRIGNWILDRAHKRREVRT